MPQTLLVSLPLSTTAPADAPPTLLEVEAAYAALAPQLADAAGELLSPSPKALAAVLAEAAKPR